VKTGKTRQKMAPVIDSTGKSRIWSRNHLPLEPKFPMVRDAVKQLELRSTILGGEIVALDKDGIPRFQLLPCQALGRSLSGLVSAFATFHIHARN
jgi:ATP-dependent DNA ligase